MSRLLSLTIPSVLFVATAALTNAQSNLLQNPNADLQSQFWRAYGRATVESCSGGTPCFVLRDAGYFFQDVNLSNDAIGRYALLIAHASTERVNPDGAITGLPALYGYMMEPGQGTGGNILNYLQSQKISLLNMKKDDWVTLWGIFQVPQGTGRIRFFLSQAERKGVPQNGSAARFDDVGLYLFPTKEEAESFVNTAH
ncbi:MAG TPA: hypothetical protein VJ372_08940 [Pyrinomonadaceae bacterium]|jgi:hypothetical protein|nr:hypothetical protein [Pyrinomonadaceae bacterium]